MKISLIGTGYVGLVSGVGFASKGHDVKCVDIVEEKVETINRGEPPIYEKGLKELLDEVISSGKLEATTDTEKAITETDVTFVCVGTPSKQDGSIDLSGLKNAAHDIKDSLKNKKDYHIVCIKSTVVPGTTDSVVLPILEKSGKEVGKDFGLGMNPEFLREGIALDDFLDPDRIVIGGIDDRTRDQIEKSYEDFDSPIIKTDIRTAEMIKYASNSLLATKISYANEVSRLCEKIGIDVYDVMDGVGLDSRIERSFLNAGCGFGGSCFPKDVKAIIDEAKKYGTEAKILKAVLQVNESQPIHAVDLLEEYLGNLEGKRIALLGLTFKGGTDDVRETRALPIARELVSKKADVIGYDPEGVSNFSRLMDEIGFTKDLTTALTDADACIIQNDWQELIELTSEDFAFMKNKVVLDARRVLDSKTLEEDITYIGLGKGR